MHVTFPSWQKEWRCALAQGDRVPLEQSWGYGEAVARRYGAKITRLFIHPAPESPPVACVQVLQKRGITQILRGPVFLSPLSLPEKKQVIQTLRHHYRWHGLTLLFPDLPDTPDHRSLLRQSRLLRVQAGYQTVYVDLAKALETLQAACRTSWRQDLRQALSWEDVDIVRVSQHAPLEWFLDAHEAFRKTTKIKAPSRAFLLTLYQNFLSHQEGMILLAKHKGPYQAGIMILSHGNTATYFAGVTTQGGRMIKANHRLLWHAMDLLQQQGIRWLDLCGLNSKTMPGVTHFKRGLRGEEVRLCGTYI
jgi:lipid II:glycine glycyltransferase (peptidoglycan interpeptide bridge formation enzyme)